MIREICADDFHGLMRLYTQLHNNPMPEPSQKILQLWKRILEDKNHHIIVAEEDGMIVSSCVCVIIPNLTHNQQPYAKELAIQENCYKLMLLTGSKEESTLRFYEKAGYNRKDKTAFIQWI